MKKRITIIGILGTCLFLFSGGYFIKLYINLTQLIVSMTFGGFLIFLCLLYLYWWMDKKDQELKEMNKAIDMTRDYIREVEKKIK